MKPWIVLWRFEASLAQARTKQRPSGLESLSTARSRKAFAFVRKLAGLLFVGSFFCATAGLTVVHAQEPQLYWAAAGGVERTSLAGGDRQPVAAAFQPAGLAVSTDGVIWSDIEPRVPITPTGVVRMLELPRATLRELGTLLPSPAGVELDELTQAVYWSDLEQHTIVRRSLAGDGAPELILPRAENRVRVHDLALDAARQTLYFTYVNPLIDSLFPGSIARLKLDGSPPETIASGFTEPWALALDAERQQLFWSDVRGMLGSQLHRLDLGTGTITTLSKSAGEVRGLAVDSLHQRLFWSDFTQNSLRSANYDGTAATTLPVTVSQPQALAIAVVPEPTTALGALVGVWTIQSICRSCPRKRNHG